MTGNHYIIIVKVDNYIILYYINIFLNMHTGVVTYFSI